MPFNNEIETCIELDRHDLYRDDPDWIAECLAHPNTRIIPSYQSRYPATLERCAKLFTVNETAELSKDPLQYYFLGELKLGESHFVFTTEILNPITQPTDWLTLRHMLINDPLSGVLFYAQGLLNWLGISNFCQRCGASLLLRNGGNSQVCSSSECANEIFPRINPAIIVLLINGDKCLLANARNFSGDIPMYSCLAGFMETGEDFEQTLKREVYEEVGLMVDDIDYKRNQAWPFPQSLMIGFHATTKETQVTFHDGEIIAAQWFSRDELESAVKSREIRLPSPKSISFTLIADWYDQGRELNLQQILPPLI